MISGLTWYYDGSICYNFLYSKGRSAEQIEFFLVLVTNCPVNNIAMLCYLNCSSFLYCSRGIIHVGDRLLAINGQALLGLSRDDVVLLLKHAHDQVSLQIEYDVCHKGKIMPTVEIGVCQCQDVLFISRWCFQKDNYCYGYEITKHSTGVFSWGGRELASVSRSCDWH